MPDPDPALLALGEPIDLADLEIEEPDAETSAANEARPGATAARAVVVEKPVPLAAPPVPADGAESELRDALSKASREVIERIAWEVIPTLAETIIREHVERLVNDRKK